MSEQQPYPAGQYPPPAPQQPGPYGNAYPMAPVAAPQPVIMLPVHPSGTIVLVLGILGYVTWITAPIAWVMGHRAEKEIKASGQRFANEQWITVGKILGIVFTIVGALSIIAVIIYVVFLLSFITQLSGMFPR